MPRCHACPDVCDYVFSSSTLRDAVSAEHDLPRVSSSILTGHRGSLIHGHHKPERYTTTACKRTSRWLSSRGGCAGIEGQWSVAAWADGQQSTCESRPGIELVSRHMCLRDKCLSWPVHKQCLVAVQFSDVMRGAHADTYPVVCECAGGPRETKSLLD